MKKTFITKAISVFVTLAMVFSPVSSFAEEAVAASETLEEETVAAFSAIKAEGYEEGAYVTWAPVTGANGYRVYVSKDTNNWGSPIDDELIRGYEGYFRADALGLTAGTWYMKVEAVTVDESKNVTGTVGSMETSGLTVVGYDRSGFAFSSKSPLYSKVKNGLGAYNNDGSLKSGATVIYVTASNAKTVKATIAGTEYVGLCGIIGAIKKEGDIVDVRIIGKINKDDTDWATATEAGWNKDEGLQIKGKDVKDKVYNNMALTIEGVGDDATISGFGIVLKNAGNVELRNFAVMNCIDDSISLSQDNCSIWIHNLDLFYGAAGGDSDQAKGDGYIDIKDDSVFIVAAYNHIWDGGKSHLCGMKKESGPNYITYHHNWYDHSDSRHPRVRTMSVHVYNNYFDGIAKYGIGGVINASIFAENNYFRNSNYPMLQGGIGTDVYRGETSFSGDRDKVSFFDDCTDGGCIIKSYNNKLVGDNTFIPYGAAKYLKKGSEVTFDLSGTTSNKEFDAYVVDTRSATVPSDVKGYLDCTYNNFDTTIDLGVSTANITAVEDVPDVVKSKAGRIDGGDFSWTFGESEDTNYAVIPGLKTAITNYTSAVKTIGGIAATTAGSSSGSGGSGSGGSGSSESGTAIGADVAVYDAISSEYKSTELFQVVGGGQKATNMTSGEYTAAGKTYTYSGNPYKLNTGASISFTTTTENAKLVILTNTECANAFKINDAKTDTAKSGVVEYEISAPGTYTITKVSESYIFAVIVIPSGKVVEVPITSVALNTTSLNLSVNDDATLIATVNPSNTTKDKTVTWTSSNPAVATVSASGQVTAIAAGDTTITATSNGDTTKSASCAVTVTAAGQGGGSSSSANGGNSSSANGGNSSSTEGNGDGSGSSSTTGDDGKKSSSSSSETVGKNEETGNPETVKPAKEVVVVKDDDGKDQAYVDFENNRTYNGKKQILGSDELTITVLDESGQKVELTYGKDYKVSYKNNKNANMMKDEKGNWANVYGDAADAKDEDKSLKNPYAIIKYKGAYKSMGTQNVFFDIYPVNMANVDLVAKKAVITAKNAQKVKFLKCATVSFFGKTKRLNLNKDILEYKMICTKCDEDPTAVGKKYDLNESIDAPAGTYRIYASGQGNFYGDTVESEFELVRK